ncbi:MAG TPA: hypothetical protein VI754_16900 [Bacteriovoracaceae bacterium]|nr:hypothetical protein [Bacteriovoracaceae bacterium]
MSTIRWAKIQKIVVMILKQKGHRELIPMAFYFRFDGQLSVFRSLVRLL